MARLKIVTYPDPRLHQPCKDVTSFDSTLHQLLNDMAETMYAAEGIGLAAPQVGELLRVTVIDVSRESNELREFINPRVIDAVSSTSSEEGCLSIPGYRDTVKRRKHVVVQAQDRNGKLFEIEAEELLAICLQHEIDHLDGVLFVDRLSRLKRELFRRWVKKGMEID